MLAASELKNTMITTEPSQKRCIVFHCFDVRMQVSWLQDLVPSAIINLLLKQT